MISSLQNLCVRILDADRFTIVVFQILDIKSNYLPGIVQSQSHAQANSHIESKSQRETDIEVTEKVDIFTSHDTVSTALHSYTSGIGLSFLSLPRHIQRLVGNILSLPAPLPFDLDETVDLIITIR
jgi:hypothetical protein